MTFHLKSTKTRLSNQPGFFVGANQTIVKPFKIASETSVPDTMSVLTYFYQLAHGELAIEKLLPAVRRKVPGIAISEIELSKTKQPNWQSLKFVHAAEPEVEMLFVIQRKNKQTAKLLEQQYSQSKETSIVRAASIVIWAQYLDHVRLPVKRFIPIFAIFSNLIAEIAILSDAVIDSPEHERLFTPSAFRRTLC